MRTSFANLLSPLIAALVLGGCVSLFIDNRPFFADQPLGALFLFPLLLPLTYAAGSFLLAFLSAAGFNTIVGWAFSGLVLGIIIGAVTCLVEPAGLYPIVLASCSAAAVSAAITFWLLAVWQPNSSFKRDAQKRAP